MLKNTPIIFNSDIKSLEKKGSLSFDEMLLLKLGQNCLETKIQQACHNIFRSEYMDNNALFVQIDNGGKMSIYQKRKKKAEGTKAGFPDVMLIRKNKVAFVEFKRIGSPSSIDVRQDQLVFNDWLKCNEFNCYITNNPVYFKEVILNEFKQD